MCVVPAPKPAGPSVQFAHDPPGIEVRIRCLECGPLPLKPPLFNGATVARLILHVHDLDHELVISAKKVP